MRRPPIWFWLHELAGVGLGLLFLTARGDCCFPTTPTGTPAPGCCPPLTQTLTQSEFPDGIMTFAYNSNTCRQSVVATCTSGDPAFNLNAAIVGNMVNFFAKEAITVSFPGTCNATDLRWYMGQPPLRLDTLECILTNPPAPGR